MRHRRRHVNRLHHRRSHGWERSTTAKVRSSCGSGPSRNETALSTSATERNNSGSARSMTVRAARRSDCRSSRTRTADYCCSSERSSATAARTNGCCRTADCCSSVRWSAYPGRSRLNANPTLPTAGDRNALREHSGWRHSRDDSLKRRQSLEERGHGLLRCPARTSCACR
jgi:hypothetical protein